MGLLKKMEIPVIKRARDYHLYDMRGRRYLDLFLDGGRALLGHKPGKTVLMMKNSLEKGPTGAYPSVYSGRLKKQLAAVYPDITAVSVVFAGGPARDRPLYRPFEDRAFPEESLFELLLPLPGSGLVRVLCAAGGRAAGTLPEPDPVPGFILSGLCRAAAELAAFGKKADPEIWKAFDSPLWERRGPWLYPKVSEEEYARLYRSFLERGILISPEYAAPSCAPYIFTEGEIKPIKDIEGEFFGNGG